MQKNELGIGIFFRAPMNAEPENKDISRLSQDHHAPSHKTSLFLMKWGNKERYYFQDLYQ